MSLPITIVVWILSLVAATGFSYSKGYHNGNESGRAVIQKQWDLQAKQQENAYRQQLAIAQYDTRSAQASADKLQKEKNDAYKTIAARDAALRNSLRNRPERPAESSGVPSDPGTCSAATGAELARGDGEFLVGYSADAAKLQKEFDHCVVQYNEVKKQINKD